MYLMHLHINVARKPVQANPIPSPSPSPIPIPGPTSTRRKSLPASSINSIFYYWAVLWSLVYGSSLPARCAFCFFLPFFFSCFYCPAAPARYGSPCTTITLVPSAERGAGCARVCVCVGPGYIDMSPRRAGKTDGSAVKLGPQCVKNYELHWK